MRIKNFLKVIVFYEHCIQKGRHISASTLISVQNYKSVSSVIRKNLTFLIVFRLRNSTDMEAILEEMSNIADKQTIKEIYEIATKDKFNFLYINLMEHDPNTIFMIHFEKRVLINK